MQVAVDPLSAEELAKFDAMSLECDGMSFMLHGHLRKHEILHRVHTGRLWRLDNKGPVTWNLFGMDVPAKDNVYHVWISLDDGRILDLRARMWFGDDAPHGVFYPTDHPNFSWRAVTEASDGRQSFQNLPPAKA